MLASQPLTPASKLELINKARTVLRGERNLSSNELEILYKQLEGYDQFAYATEILLVKMKVNEKTGKPTSKKEYETLAKYIYKDHSLPSSFKLERAIQELNIHDDLNASGKCETLGLAGAIYKRKWQFDHQFKNLALSRFYYKQGYDFWQEYLQSTGTRDKDKNDDGFTAINYAYISDLMAVDKLEQMGAITGVNNDITQHLKDADETREFILTQFVKKDSNPPELNKNDYQKWVIPTVAEAYFGLRKYKEAVPFIKSYVRRNDVQAWEVRTFQQQLFSIAYLQGYIIKFAEDNPGCKQQLQDITSQIDTTGINQCIVAFSPDDTNEKDEIEQSVKNDGKTGIALSGGGFRASLFQIGVLAALAEQDRLKDLEVISCVSGGSIIGAYYYLKLKELFETKTDEEIAKGVDQKYYIKMVQDIEKDFLEGVQKNLRMRVFSNLWCNMRMLFDKHYSRTHRMGELYEKHLYKKIWENNPLYSGIFENNKKKIFINDLFINPKVKDGETFNFSTDNWKRINKVPQLVLNATSVNTGHNWQFTASWMGEPPGNIQADIDVKPRLRRMYYNEAPDRYRQLRLGYAVGASSCVPVMFHPMPMFDLYPGIDLQLIDGGLHDNQGIAALIEQECRNMIICDASGQLPTEYVATKNEAAVFWRADNILQERLRELQFLDINERSYTAQLKTVVSVHLKNDLQQNPVSWKYCTDPPRSIVYAHLNEGNNDLTTYGILRDSESMLSEIRTDLDSFNDIEAKALMYSGYVQTHYEYNKIKNRNEPEKPADWKFLSMKDYLTQPAKAEAVKETLAAGKKRAFKVLYISKPLKIIAIAAGILLLAWLFYLGIEFYDATIVHLSLTVKFLFYTVIIFCIGLVSKFLAAIINYKSTIRKNLAFIFIMLAGFVISNIYLLVFNKIYNKTGRVKE